jgi:hypothetical protein
MRDCSADLNDRIGWVDWALRDAEPPRQQVLYRMRNCSADFNAGTGDDGAAAQHEPLVDSRRAVPDEELLLCCMRGLWVLLRILLCYDVFIIFH